MFLVGGQAALCRIAEMAVQLSTIVDKMPGVYGKYMTLHASARCVCLLQTSGEGLGIDFTYDTQFGQFVTLAVEEQDGRWSEQLVAIE
ncbi:hypothetical protein D3C81_1910480 [compost metagenome]